MANQYVKAGQCITQRQQSVMNKRAEAERLHSQARKLEQEAENETAQNRLVEGERFELRNEAARAGLAFEFGEAVGLLSRGGSV